MSQCWFKCGVLVETLRLKINTQICRLQTGFISQHQSIWFPNLINFSRICLTSKNGFPGASANSHYLCIFKQSLSLWLCLSDVRFNKLVEVYNSHTNIKILHTIKPNTLNLKGSELEFDEVSESQIYYGLERVELLRYYTAKNQYIVFKLKTCIGQGLNISSSRYIFEITNQSPSESFSILGFTFCNLCQSKKVERPQKYFKLIFKT